MNITSGQTGIIEEREDEKGARLHLIGFLILCDDAAQAVVSKQSFSLVGLFFLITFLNQIFFLILARTLLRNT